MTATRRSVLLGSAAATAALAGPRLSVRPAAAAAMAPDTQHTALYHFKVGDISVSAATDGMFTLDLSESFVVNAEFDAVKQALADRFLPTDKLNIPFTPLIVRAGEDTILLDTGFADNGPPSAGQLARGLEASGLAPADITKVIISHYHPDHINGLKTKAGDIIYPNAEVLVPEAEHAYWTDAGNKASAAENRKGNFDLVANKLGDLGDRLSTFAWGAEVSPGITAVDAKGHTPGHTAFVIASGDDSMMFLADTTNHPALFVRNPDWSAVFDQDADQARATRRKLLDMAVADRITVAGYHFPFPAVGHIAKDGDGFALVPVQWMPVVQ